MAINELIQTGQYEEALAMIPDLELPDWKKTDLKVLISFQQRSFETIPRLLEIMAGQIKTDKLQFKVDLYHLYYLIKRGLMQEARDFLNGIELIIDDLDEEQPEDRAILGNYYHYTGSLFLHEGNTIESEHHLLQARRYRILREDISELAGTLNNLGVVYVRKGVLHQAIEYYNEALDIFMRLGNQINQAMTRNNLGLLHSSRGELYLAKQYLEENMVFYTDIGTMDDIGRTLTNLGEIYRQFGDFEYAAELLDQSLEFKIEDGNPQNIFASYYYLALCEIEANKTRNLDNIVKELEYYLNKNPTKLNTIRYLYVKAIRRYYSSDLVDRESLIENFQGLIDIILVDPEVTFNSILFTVELLLEEGIQQGTSIYLERIYKLLDNLEHRSKQSAHHLFHIKSILLRAKLCIIQGQFDLSEELYTSALEIASIHELQAFKFHIERELEKLELEMKNWPDYSIKHKSIIERLQNSMLTSYIKDVKRLIDDGRILS